MKEMGAVRKLAKLPAEEVGRVIDTGAAWELISNALYEVLELHGSIPFELFEDGVIGVVQSAYYLGYKMGKKAMPVFVVGEE